MLRDLILRNRSYRRFQQDVSVEKETLCELVDLARLSASAANRQPLKYFLSWEPARNKRIFPYLAWAGYLTDWPGPREGERPAAYIVILGDTGITEEFDSDPGIACQSILLGATERGLGGCIFGAVDRKGLQKEFSMAPRYRIIHVIALGVPLEKVVLEDMQEKQDYRYWRDERGIHHVPKRPLSQVVLEDEKDLLH